MRLICVIILLLGKISSFIRVIQPRVRLHGRGRASMGLSIPKDVKFQPSDVEILRYLGKIDMLVDKKMLDELKKDMDRRGGTDNRAFMQWNPLSEVGRATSVRVFEAKISGGKKCFLKEYLPLGTVYGRRELALTRHLRASWNDACTNPESDTVTPTSGVPPFPLLLGSLRTDERVEDPNFTARWKTSFPRVVPPSKGNIWLIFEWDESTFKSMKRFAPLPQVVEGLDYFRKDSRLGKRWSFVRATMRHALQALDFLHRAGFSHGAVSGESIWMTTTNQQEAKSLGVKMTDLGNANKFSDLGSHARTVAYEDIYQLGLVFLELVFASFSDDTYGAQNARRVVQGIYPATLQDAMMKQVDVHRDMSQYSQREFQTMFESFCNSDFKQLRQVTSQTPGWEGAVSMLEADGGAGWKLIFRMLGRGSLYESDGTTKLKVSCSRLVRGADSDLFQGLVSSEKQE